MLELKDTQIKNTLPESIKFDQTVNDICDSIQAKFDGVYQDTFLVVLLANLDKLSEALVDELAWQFHVDFYRDNYPIENKRKLVRTAIERHRHKGTPAAVEEIIKTIYNHAVVEEWFEYEADPYHFRVLLKASLPAPPLSLAEVISLINQYKSFRSHLDGVYYHCPHDLVIGTHFGYACYRVRVCGTYPQRARRGKISKHDLVVGTKGATVVYRNPYTNEVVTGTFPVRSTEGALFDDQIVMQTDGTALPYINNKTGVTKTGTIPERASIGTVKNSGITANTAAGDISYNVRYCGSKPGSLM